MFALPATRDSSLREEERKNKREKRHKQINFLNFINKTNQPGNREFANVKKLLCEEIALKKCAKDCLVLLILRAGLLLGVQLQSF